MPTDEIPISEIERELTRVWRGMTAEATGASGAVEPDAATPPAVMRATTINLIVAGCGREGLSEVLAETARRDPCRAIVIETDESRAEPRAWVSALCHRVGRGLPQVCSEQIILSGPSAGAHVVFGSVAGLLVADVPTFVWWRARLPESDAERDRFDHIVRLADRFLFDSARCAGEQLDGIAAFVAARRVRSVGDVNWARLMSWRSHVARLFDPPTVRELLAKTESACLFHQTPQPDAASRLMAGWLRSRLGRPRIEFRQGDAPSLELRAGGQVFITPCPVLLSESEALSEELRVLGRDEVFEQALAAAIE